MEGGKIKFRVIEFRRLKWQKDIHFKKDMALRKK